MAWLSLILNLLYKYYTNEGKSVFSERRTPLSLVISSYIIPESGFTTLLSGRVHPMTALRDAQKRPWWEDIWDAKQFRKDPGMIYWPGWRALCERIYMAVENFSAGREARDLIDSGKHPFLT